MKALILLLTLFCLSLFVFFEGEALLDSDAEGDAIVLGTPIKARIAPDYTYALRMEAKDQEAEGDPIRASRLYLNAAEWSYMEVKASLKRLQESLPK